MRKNLITIAIGTLFVLGGCSAPANNNTASSVTTTQSQASNVLLQTSPLQYHAPQYDKVVEADYLPAFRIAIKQSNAEIEQIVNNPAPVNFDNTLGAFERSGQLLTRVSSMFFNMSSLMSNDNMVAIQNEILPDLTAHEDNVFMNKKLFARVSELYQQKDQLKGEEKRLTEFYYNNFVRAGAKLTAAEQAKVRQINGELAKSTSAYGQNILSSFKNDVVLVTDVKELDGLSADEIASLKAEATNAGKSGYMITLVNTTGQPILAQLNNRALRERIWKVSTERATKTNGPLVIKLAKLRAEKAALLGYKNWASYSVANQMAKTPDAVYTILDNLAPKAVNKAKNEAKDIQAEMAKEGANFTLQPWDWAYYSAKVRNAKFQIDESQVKPYFEFNRVLNDGLFYAMNKLYGITIKPRNDLPVWEQDVTAYEVFDKDGTSLGLFYLDPYARPGKNGGAWMNEAITQSGLLNAHPVIYNALNIPKPAAGQPTLLTFDEVTTMFHEFGHALHGMFSDVKYPSIAGTATARDFVEYPSQFNEDWAINPQVLANYAKHYKTGKAIPTELLNKIMKSHTFNQGHDTTEYLAAAILDMEWHSISADTPISSVEKFEHAALAKHGIAYAPVPPRYKSNYFSHSFSGGYSASYYAYLWTELLAADTFAYMGQHGGLTLENGAKFRKEVLSKGNSEDLMGNYLDYKGSEPTIDALLKRRGLTE
ncbi:M3 family metallopeptidase [Shewanella intestini]|uniref:M3 family metallopeptidase n=1 Tax=Shewanella intestini TaxID=2017544 RepID=A0ABS5HZ37_9GAMM|nr:MULTISPECIES: M3 family metallopeptidase [Shewanella]MBR9727006.1 M3 family metallopeptidase [Shewanella intestini]MRG35807.1 dipeptidyl carboxypeptidase II [Shewanella sp. XMDDZSB0408]